MRCGDGLDSRTTPVVPENECHEDSFDFKCGMTPPSDAVSSSETERATTAVGRKMEQCAGWIQEARDSLRGRRLFTLLAVVNLVIPGGSEEFNGFIQKTLHTDRPDVFLGILQSGYILGVSAACFVFTSLARRRSPFGLMAAGLGMWCEAAVFAGVANPLGSYAVILVARLLSGVGEASLVTVVPPLITDTAPPGERGLWLALLYTAQPVGAGIAYVYGSALANSGLGWPSAFYVEAFFMAPLAMACSLVPRDRATAVSNASECGASLGLTATPTTEQRYGGVAHGGAGLRFAGEGRVVVGGFVVRGYAFSRGKPS